MGTEYVKYDEADLAFSRSLRSDYWNDDYDVPIQHCPHCGSYLDPPRPTRAVLTTCPDETGSLTTDEDTCSDCDQTYIRLVGRLPTPVQKDIDLGPDYDLP